MDMLSSSWICELGMEDPFPMDECELLKSFDEDLAAALGDDYQNSFSPESNSSSSTLISSSSSTAVTTTAATANILYASSPIEAPPDHYHPPPQNNGLERATKQRKPNNYKSCTPKLDKSPPPPPPPAPFILNFSNSNIDLEPIQHGHLRSTSLNLEDEVLSDDASGNKGGAGKKRKSGGRTRPPSQTYDHIIAERKRREQLSQLFASLSAIVPGLKKMDKSSVLGDAIKYMKQLQERLQTLEEQCTNQTMESVVLVHKSQLLDADEDCSIESSISSSNHPLPEIEARTCGKNILLRIHCEKHKGVLVKILSEIEKMNLTIINTGVSSFGGLALDITIMAEMEKEFSMSLKDIVRRLRAALRRVN